MSSSLRHLHQLARRVRRRMMLCRAGERVAISLCTAAGLWLIILLIGRSSVHQPALAGAVLGGIGVMVGILWSLHQPVKLIDALLTTDAQLRLSDLLSSAWAAQDRDDEFSRHVIALADARCAQIQVGDLVLHRLGMRAWSGMGLILALVVTLSLLIGPAEHQSIASSDTPAHPWSRSVDAGKSSTDFSNAAAFQKTPAGNPTTPSREFDASAVTGDPGQSAQAQTSGHQIPSSIGEGRASGRTTRSEQNFASGASDAKSIDAAAASSDAATGGGRALGDSSTSSGEPTRTASAAAEHGTIPPWREASWAQSQQQVDHQLQAGQIDAKYRDMIRDYFDRR